MSTSGPTRKSVASRSPASATARAASCRALSSTATPTPPARAGADARRLGGYRRRRRFVAAFDVDADKVGLDLGKAISASINNTIKFADVPELGVLVQGPTFDGLGKYYREVVEESPAGRSTSRRPCATPEPTCWSRTSRSVPKKHSATARSGARRRRRFRQCDPVFIASNPEWAKKFERGRADHRRRHQEPGRRDDHAPLARTTVRRPRSRDRQHVPAELRRQHGLQEHGRAALHQEGLEDSVGHEPDRSGHQHRPRAHRPLRPCAVAQRHKWAYIRLEGRNFGDVPLNVELKLEVWDSPNSAGVIIDAVRCAKLALDPRHRWSAARPIGVLHEVAADPVPRRRSPPNGGGILIRFIMAG